MIDREKVINGLEQCISADKTCFGCPYDGTNCTITLSADALAMLNEDETRIQYLKDHIAMYKEEVEREQENASKRNPVIVCPHCGKRVK